MLISPYKIPDICPPSEHPRVMLRKQDLERIRKTIREQSAVSSLFDKLCAFPIEGTGATPKYGTYHLKEYLALEATALKSLLYGDGALGRTSVETLLRLLRTARFEDPAMRARFAGHLIFLSAEVYDWCYPQMTEEERSEVISRCEGLAEQSLEMGYPPSKQAAISGHGNEAQLLRDLLAFSIAVYDERPDIYNYCAGRLFDEYLPTYKKVFAGEFHPQGPCYGSYRYAWALWFGLLIFSMSGAKILPEHTAETADSFLYLRRNDGEAIRLGDDYNEKKALYTRTNPFAVPLFLASAYTGEPHLDTEAEIQLCPEYLIPHAHGSNYYSEGAYGEGVISPSVYFIWKNLTATKEIKKRPVGRYFDWPAGCTVYNDGERLILMKIGCLWGSNHDHLDTGCFQIYDGEILASDSGVYDSYGTEHRKHYTIQTVAHNCLLVDGMGTRQPCERKEPKTLDTWLTEYTMATVLKHTETQDLYEIEGDLSKAYENTCRFVTRKLRWEPNKGERGTLTVYDRVVPLKKDAKVTFLLHCQSQPIVNGLEIVVPGKKRNLCCHIKQPTDVSIDVIGGPGRQFEVNGKQYEPTKHTSEEGWGRIEITAVGEVTFEITLEIQRKEENL